MYFVCKLVLRSFDGSDFDHYIFISSRMLFRVHITGIKFILDTPLRFVLFKFILVVLYYVNFTILSSSKVFFISFSLYFYKPIRKRKRCIKPSGSTKLTCQAHSNTKVTVYIIASWVDEGFIDC